MILTKSIVLTDNSKHSAIATMKQNGNNIDVSVKNINGMSERGSADEKS